MLLDHLLHVVDVLVGVLLGDLPLPLDGRGTQAGPLGDQRGEDKLGDTRK
jgi:hypothetical protein